MQTVHTELNNTDLAEPTKIRGAQMFHKNEPATQISAMNIKKITAPLQLLVFVFFLFFWQYAVAQASFYSVAVSPQSGTVALGASLYVTVTGGTHAAVSSDSVNVVELIEGTTSHGNQIFNVILDPNTEVPVNQARSISIAANLPAGTHTMFLRAYTYNGGYSDSPPFSVTVTEQTVNGATFVGQSVPLAMVAGQTYNATVTMRNTGSKTWFPNDPSYPHRLGSQNPENNSTWGMGRVPSASSVVPGETVTFSFPVTAPNSGGTFNFQWRMVQDAKEWFGDYTPNQQIRVDIPSPVASIATPADGSTFTITSGSDTVVSFSGSATPGSGATLNSVQLLENGVAFASGSSTSISGSKALTAGSHIIEIRVTDSRNQVASAYRTVRILPRGPTSSINSPVQGAIFDSRANAVTVAVAATSNPAAGTTISQIKLFVDGSLTATGTAANLNASISLATGSHTLGVEGVDSNGTVGQRSQITVSVTKSIATSGAEIYSIASSPQNGTVDPGAKLPVTVTGGTHGISGDAVNMVELIEGNTSHGYQIFPVMVDPYTEIPVNTERSISIVASLGAGTHNLFLRASTVNGGSFDSQSFTVTVTEVTVNGAAFVSQTPPPLDMFVGHPYTATVTMRNTGTRTWVSTDPAFPHLLSSQNPQNNTTWGTGRVASVTSVAPGATVTFQVPVTAPSSPGTFDYQWRMIQDGKETFGDFTPNLQLNVTVPPASATIATPSEGASFPIDTGSSTVVSFSGSAAPGSRATLSNVQLLENGVAFGSGTSSSITASKSLSAGSHTIELRVTDSRNQVASAFRTVKVVPPGPISSISSPVNGAVFEASSDKVNVDVRANAVSAAGITVNQVKLFVDGALTATGTTASLDTSVLLPAGSHTLAVEAVDNNGTVGTRSQVTVAITAPAAPTTAQLLPVSITPPHLGNPDAGTLPGELTVSTRGTATYSLPIEVPPGSAGVKPDLSLDYDSSGQNSILGLGWALKGSSRIHRCGKTIATDGGNSRISFTNADRLCLDGQRLVVVNKQLPTDANYWSDTAEYRTEINNFSRISAQGTGSQRSFKVEFKDGRVATYGRFSASGYASAIVQPVQNVDPLAGGPYTPPAKSGAQSWGIDQVKDRSGNYINYFYEQDPTTGEHLLRWIRYGGNTLPAHAAVELIYESRPDAWKRYVDESRNDLRKRISHIKTYVGVNLDVAVSENNLVRDYTISYERSPTSGRSLLTAVKACARSASSGATTCLPQTNFAWGKPDASKVAGFEPVRYWPGSPILSTHNTSGKRISATHADYFAYADFENHGFTDVLEKRVSSPLEPSSEDGDNLSQANPIPRGALRSSYRYFHNNGAGFTEYQYRIEPSQDFAVLDTSDFDGDGSPDLIVSTVSGPKICLSPLGKGDISSIANPIVFTCSSAYKALGENDVTKLPYAVDVKGDGRSGLYSPVARSNGSAQYCLQFICHTDYAPPLTILSPEYQPYANALIPEQSYVSFTKMIDFTGTGKPSDVRWTQSRFTQFENDSNGELVSVNRWENLLPRMLMTEVRQPSGLETAPPGNVTAYAYKEYVMQCGSSTCARAPYYFETPHPGASLAADFNGSGYGNTMFGFVEDSMGSTGFPYASRADATFCLFTGRTFDCSIRAKISGQQYKGIRAIGDFVGDGAPAVLVETMNNRPDRLPVPTGNLELCRVMGDDTTKAPFNESTDSNLSCSPWGGISIPPPKGLGYTADPVLLYMDLLGTGRTQLVIYRPAGYDANGQWQEQAGRWEVYAPRDLAITGQALDRIYQVTNGLGAVATVEFVDGLSTGVVTQSSATMVYPSHLMARADKVVSRLKKPNGTGAPRSMIYRYKNEVVDMRGRGSLGFAEVVETDEQSGINTTTRLRQQWPFTGMAEGLQRRSANGTLLSDMTHLLEKKTMGQIGSYSIFPYITETIETRADLDGTSLGSVTTNQVFSSDNYGNLEHLTVTSTGNGETFVQKTDKIYSNDSSTWLIGLPTSIVEKRSSSNNLELARTVEFTYSPTTGLVDTQTIEPRRPLYEVKTSYERLNNPFGLVTAKRQSWLDPLTQLVSTRSLEQIEYEAMGRFPKNVSNALFRTSTQNYDPGTGSLIDSTDANNLKTVWEIDGFGRVLRELQPDGNETRRYLKDCQQGCPLSAAVVAVTERFNGSARIETPQINYLDNVGRLLRNKRWGFDGAAIVTDQRFDPKGRLFETDIPRREDGNSFLSKRINYDDLDRITSEASFDDNNVLQTATVEFSGFKRTLTNTKRQKRVDSFNMLGQVINIVDALDNETSFLYEPFGALSKTTDSGGNVTFIEYDVLGRKTSLNDPDLGLLTYAVDPIGRTFETTSPEVRKMTSGPKKITMQFDTLDRMIARIEPDLESHWIYDTASYGIGSLAEAYTGTAALKDYRRLHTYDSTGKLVLTAQKLTDNWYYASTDFDAWSRVSRVRYRRGTDAEKAFESRYNAFGYLSHKMRGTTILREFKAFDASGRPTLISFGNGLTQTRDFYEYSGRLKNAKVMSGSNEITIEGYQYDVLGNMSNRTQYAAQRGFHEVFEYDSLNRLLNSQVLGQTKLEYVYDALGNIINKPGVGTYTYPQPGMGVVQPHAVTDSTKHGAFKYDDNGNLSAGAGRAYKWTSFDMPQRISQAGFEATFVYGPEHQRLLQTRTDSTVIYAGAQEVETKNGQVTVKTYWPDGIGVEIDRPNQARELNWTHVDRLGSVFALTSEAGTVRESLAYDPWGKRRTIDGGSTPDDLNGATDNKGFTGHEMLDQLDLVHMNGRVYDPLIARFLSGDPVNSDPTNGQSYNRYSYVVNNPTNLTDPTGFDFCERKVYCSSHSFTEVPENETVGGNDKKKLVQTDGKKTGTQIAKGGGDSANSTGGAKPVGGGCDSGTQCIPVVGKRDTTSPWRLGVEWLTGTGPRQRTFTDGDPFAEMLRKHRHVQSVIQGVKSGELAPKGRANYSVGGWKGVPLYLHDYSNLLTGGNTGNLAVTFLGSYGLAYEVNDGVLTMTITNNSTIASATHPPVLGYTPWWRQNVEPTLNRQFESGPLSKISQTVILHERMRGDEK